MLFQTFGKIKTTTIMIAIILIAIGVVMLLCPVAYVDSFIDLMGYVILVLAAVLILEFIGSSSRGLTDYITFSVGLFLMITGIAILVFTDNIPAVLSWLFGILLILDGLGHFLSTIVFVRRSGRSAWIFLAVLSLVMVAAGVVIIVNPWWKTTAQLLYVLGYTVLFSALVAILRVVMIWPFKSE